MFPFLASAAMVFLSAVAWEPCTEGRISEVTFRRRAVRKVTPVIPEEAIKVKAQGVTVAQIRLDVKGEISSIEILESPHESIARATAEAVKNWAFYFDSKKDEKPICITSKLTFYFVLENGSTPVVRDPKRFK